LAIISMTSSLQVSFCARILQGCFMSYTVGAISYIIETTPPDLQQKRLSYAGSMFGLGFLAASCIGGPLASYNIVFPIMTASYFALINALLILTLPPLPVQPFSTLSPKNIFKTLSAPLKIQALQPIMILRGIGEIGTALVINSVLEQLRILENFQLSPQGRSFFLTRTRNCFYTSYDDHSKLWKKR